MERFYYDQDCEFRQRPFEVATYGEIVPFIRDADAGRLRLYMERGAARTLRRAQQR